MSKVLVGLSGGVDSAVAAYLLKEHGYDVTCCFMRNWDSALNNDTLGNPTLNDDICPQEKDYNDALAVSEKLGLPLLRVDYIEEYWNNVFQNFIDEYKKGRTPNPDILCNKYIKFDAFLKFALEHDFDYIATGHYVKKSNINGKDCLLKAVDTNKDQSYFLAQIAYSALEKSIFPLGDLTKQEVRKIAHDLDLPVADKKDSTGVCFIGERNFREFLKNYIPMKEGKIIDIETREVIGNHQGVYYYTIGQRKGFGVGGNHGPYFCVGKDVFKNELYLASQDDKTWLYSDACLVNGFNFLHRLDSDEFDCVAKFRYRQKDIPVHVKFIDKETCYITSYGLMKATTVGQQAVLYLNDICIGGGVIDKTFLEGKDKDELLKESLDNGRK